MTEPCSWRLTRMASSTSRDGNAGSAAHPNIALRDTESTYPRMRIGSRSLDAAAPMQAAFKVSMPVPMRCGIALLGAHRDQILLIYHFKPEVTAGYKLIDRLLHGACTC